MVRDPILLIVTARLNVTVAVCMHQSMVVRYNFEQNTLCI